MIKRIARWLIPAFVLAPFIPMIIWSLGRKWFFPALLPEEFSMKAWNYVFSTPAKTGEAFWNSITIATIVTLLAIVIGLPAGRALGLYKFRGKTLVEFLVLAPTIIPTLAVAMGIHITFIRYGLADTYRGVVLVHLIPVMPYMVLILSSAFSNYDVEYEEQAQTLGASWTQRWMHVTLPTIFPSLMVGSLFAFIISWSQYILTILIGGGRIITLPTLLFSLTRSGNNSTMAAMSLVFILPAVIFLILVARYLSGKGSGLGSIGNV